MSASLNRASIIGNLGADPEVRSTSGGTRVATLSVATNRRWTDDAGEEHERTEWHRVVAWERLAEICEEYLSKSDRIYVEGRIQYRQWEGEDGQTRYTTEIVARRFLMLGSPGERGRLEPSRQREPAPARGGAEDVVDEPPVGGDDDLPF